MNVLQPYPHNSAMASTSGVLYPDLESTVIDEIRKVPTNSSTAQLICQQVKEDAADNFPRVLFSWKGTR